MNSAGASRAAGTSKPLTLQSAQLEAEVDPGHGGEVVALRGRPSGLSLLGAPRFAPRAPRSGDLDERTWTERYRGGWQLLTPNAGDACVVAGERHGFHGRASNDPWELLEASAQAARLRWTGHGQTVTRTYRLDGAALVATTVWEATEKPVPMIHVEHVTVGSALLDPEVEIMLPALRDGTPARADGWRREWPRASFAAIGELTAGDVAIVNPATGVRVRLVWDAEQLPYVWLWHELRGTGGVWGFETEILGVEPAATCLPTGLADAIEAGHATWLEPGCPVKRQIAVHVAQGRLGP